MDYASLRQEGIRLLERMAGGQWTDFNAHDPGITLLEQLCYVLSDLAYRTQYALPDLLADGGSDPYASLHPPEAILTSQPVTLDDLRRLVLDVDGVKNAWVEPAAALPLSYIPGRRELRLLTSDLSAQPIALRGLYRVLIEPTGDVEETVVKANAARQLHHSRGLGEDFAELAVLKLQYIQVEATVEVAPVDDLGELMARIRDRLAAEISPAVPFATLSQLLDAGVPSEEIFDGPLLRRGFLTAAALAQATRKTVIHTSDLMHAIVGVSGVLAVSRIRISKGGAWEEWALPIDADKVARLEPAGLKLTLRRAGRVLATRTVPPAESARATAAPEAANDPGRLAPPAGRNRNAGRYSSVQPHLPALYGIGDLGLPESASPERKALARQLRAYLMYFDQILANSFTQLAHVKDLFSHHSGAQTYFTQALDQPGLGLEEIRALDDRHRGRLQELVETPESAAALERKNRFLNHLLARFAEPLGDHTPATSLSERAQHKRELLQNYPRCSGSRGTAFDCLATGPRNQSGLAQRIQLLLGLDGGAQEELILVEHILLRPMKEDLLSDAQGRPLEQEVPLLAAARQPDPYSLQVTFVLPDGVGRFAQPEFKRFVEQALRQETPAHLFPYVYWMEPAAWQRFKGAHAEWLRMQREYSAESLSVKLEAPGSGTRAIDLRGARDRLIDLLGLGETYPLQDTAVRAQRITVSYNTAVAFDIDPSQPDVRYELYVDGAAATPARLLNGTGAAAVLAGPAIIVDHSFQVRAFKIDRPQRQLYLLQQPTVKIGLNDTLPVATPKLDAIVPMVDYGSQVEVAVADTQSGVTYRLIDPQESDVSTAPVLGNGTTISILSKPIREDTVLRVLATRDFEVSENRSALRAILIARLPIAVRANPGAGLSVDGSPICDHLGTATVTIAASQESVQYSAYVRDLTDADFVPAAPLGAAVLTVPVPGAAAVRVVNPPRPAVWQVQPGYALRAQSRGNGGALQLRLESLGEDCAVIIQAHKVHSVVPATSDLQLQQAAILLIRPQSAPALALQLTPSANGQRGVLRVSGGQPGVYYHFLRESESGEFGLPAYFQKLDDADPTATRNKGVGQVRLETDLVVAGEQPPASAGADLARLRPLDPVVEVAPLPQGSSVSVLAVKARTRVRWSASRPVAITPNPNDP